jgi:hypothetical protein
MMFSGQRGDPARVVLRTGLYETGCALARTVITVFHVKLGKI